MREIASVLCCLSFTWILQVTDGTGSITWYEPPPVETTADPSDIRTINIELINASTNEQLSWNFSLTTELNPLQSVGIFLGVTQIVNIALGFNIAEVARGFEDRFNFTWINSQQITLIIFKVTKDVAGDFACQVTTLGGGTKIWKRTFRVTVVVPPKITDISGNQTVTEGYELHLNCSATGDPVPNITWTRLCDRTVVTMPLINIRRQDGGGYRCTANNSVGFPAFKDVYINVQYPPNITSISSNQTVAEGDVVLLNCTADGNPEPNITWRRLSDNSIVIMPLTITGKQDEGFYRCTAGNGIGYAATSDVFITVQSYRPINTVFSTNFTNNTVNLNDNFALICNADANPEEQYRLYSEQESLEEQSNGTYLTFVSTRTKQVTYRCIPFNSFGDGPSKTINVTVHYNPATVHLVANTTENRICSDFLLVNFTCAAAEANPPVERYQLLEGQEILDTSSNWTWIKNISKKGHIYSCRALHPAGNVTSSDLTLTFNVPVQVQVSVHVKSGSVTLAEGGSVSLKCNASGYPEPTVTWTKLGADEFIISSQWLNFTNISREETGEYICNASNTCEEKPSSLTTIDVQYKPSEVIFGANPSENKNCADFLLVNFTCDASEANPPVNNYQLLKGQEIVNTSSKGTWIKNITKKGDHIYHCKALHSLGNVTSAAVTVTFNVPVQVSVHVKSGSVTLGEGDSLSLECDASGYPQPTVTWSKLNANGLIISSQWLNFTNISKEASGEYICNASNTCGEKRSSATTIDVQYKPSNVILVANPSENVNCSDFLLVNFTCEAAEANPPVGNYQLLKSEEIVNTSSKGLWIKNITKKGGHFYSCKALHPLGNVTSPDVTVTFNVPVQVSVQIKSGSVTPAEGGSFSLECDASGYPQPTVTWSKLNAFEFIISSQWLNFTNISKEATGEYICNASNTCGERQSSATTIDVQYKPSNVILVANPTENENCSDFLLVRFTCEAAEANPPVENYQLLKSEEIVDTSSKGTWIKNITKKGGHFYSCRALHPLGNVTSPDVTVTFSVPVQISVHVNSGSETLMEGGNVSLNCDASAYPKPTVTWSKLNADEFIHVISSQWLNFTNISREATGNYTCNANNTCGKNRSSVRIIDVQYAAEATGKGGDYSVPKGTSKLFSCPVDGNPEPNITWYKDTGVIRQESFTAIDFFGPEISTAKQLETNETGCYICSASNSLGPPVNIKQCLVEPEESTSATSTSTRQPTKQVHADLTLLEDFVPEYRDLNNPVSKRLVDSCVKEVDKIYQNDDNYLKCEVTGLRSGSVIVSFIVYFKNVVAPREGLAKFEAAISNGTFGTYQAGNLTLLSPEVNTFMSTTLRTSEPTDGPPWIIIGAVAGGVVLVALVVAFVTWWVHKKRKCIKDTKIHNSECEESLHGYSPHASVNRAYAESGPPSANGSKGAAQEQSQDPGAIPTYAVVDKSKKKKKAEEKPPIYAAVDKSKKRKKKTDDKNLYDSVEEPKKEKKPGEVLYAELGDFQNPEMPEVSTSPATLPPLKRPPSYEQTQYADITAFLKGDATLPQKEGNEGSEMQQQSANQSQHDVDNKETPIQEESPCSRVNGAYAKSGPPSANSTDVSFAAQKQPAQEAGAIPTYEVVDKSKKKKKEPDEMPLVNIDMGKSKKKKKKTDDKNLYDSVEEPKKEKKPGEIFYADLGEFQKQEMPKVATSPPTLPPLKRAPSYEKTDYAEITEFLRKEATLPKVATSPPTLPPIKGAPCYEKTDNAEITQFLKKEATLPREKSSNSEMKPQAANQTHDEVENKETAL